MCTKTKVMIIILSLLGSIYAEPGDSVTVNSPYIYYYSGSIETIQSEINHYFTSLKQTFKIEENKSEIIHGVYKGRKYILYEYDYRIDGLFTYNIMLIEYKTGFFSKDKCPDVEIDYSFEYFPSNDKQKTKERSGRMESIEKLFFEYANAHNWSLRKVFRDL